jgi:NitT/TauT family transport system permease protein
MPDTSLTSTASIRRVPNLFDLAAMLCIAAGLIAVGNAARHTLAPLSMPEAVTIHLAPSYLPGYALRTTLRMFAALALSLLFTFTYASWAAKSRRARMVLVPILDILQSLPISQAWNMAFSMYQSLTTVPADLDEATRGFRLTAWQRFWRLEVPFAMPGLIWNMMMSMSGGWFALVASEAISVGNTTFTLPGIGSYIKAALDARDIHAVLYAIAAMLLVILAYDQLLFRPLVAWSAKFRLETTQSEQGDDPWMLALLRRTRFLRFVASAIGDGFFAISGLRLWRSKAKPVRPDDKPRRSADVLWLAILGIVVALAIYRIVTFCIASHLTLGDLRTAFVMGLYTLTRVVVLMILATAVWVPVGVMVGLRPVLAKRVGAAAQFLAAFPANLLFPIFVVFIIRYSLNPDIWLTPLIILGAQFYILFNVVAGANAFPGDLREAARNFRVGGLLWWRRIILPGIFPYFVTGAITASGGAWNAAVIAEVVSWGKTTLKAHGLGAYIQEAMIAGDSARVLLGMVVMAAFVLSFNRLVWRPMYAYSSRRLRL